MRNDKLLIEISVDTLSMLLAGLFFSSKSTRLEAIPESLFFELSEKLYPYLRNWDYTRCSLEEWVGTMLLIAPKGLIPEDDLKIMQSDNEIYFERWLGNAILIVSAPCITTQPNNNIP